MNNKEQTARQKLIEELYTMKLEKEMSINDVMRYLYIEKGMTQKTMADELHVSVGTINKWLFEAGVPAKKMKWV